MADYTPNTILKILKDIPLDNTYTDTIKFESVSAQTSYFTGKAKYTYDNLSYQRVNYSVAPSRGPSTIRISQPPDDLYDCNYIMFQNTSHGSKWFYAFIVSVNFVNMNTTEIQYEIDHYQTWAFDFTVLPSYVEREHTLNDGLYANLVPEPFSESDMLCTAVTRMDASPDHTVQIVIATTGGSSEDKPTIKGMMQDNIYSGLNVYTVSDPTNANAFIQAFSDQGKLDRIVSVSMAPYDVNATARDGNAYTITRPANVSGYVPKNNKVLAYPFVKITLTNRSGSSKDFYYENFMSYATGGGVPANPEFYIYRMVGVKPKLFAVPINYGGVNSPNVGTGRLFNDQYVVEVGDFPQCPWTGNVYANWLASGYQNSTLKSLANVLTMALTGYVGGGTSAAVTSAETGALRAGQTFVDNQIDRMTAAKTPLEMRGTVSDTDLSFVTRNSGFDIRQMAVRPEIARVADDFFSMFGYATNQLKVPNMTGRASWNYVKTDNVIINGSIPVDAMARIKTMFNSGIRFWHTTDVGNYALPNNIVEEVTV